MLRENLVIRYTSMTEIGRHVPMIVIEHQLVYFGSFINQLGPEMNVSYIVDVGCRIGQRPPHYLREITNATV